MHEFCVFIVGAPELKTWLPVNESLAKRILFGVAGGTAGRSNARQQLCGERRSFLSERFQRSVGD